MTQHKPHYSAEVHDRPDSWHHHAAAEGVPQHEHARVASPGTIARWFVGMVVTLVGSVTILILFFNHEVSQARATRIESTAMSAEYAAMRVRVNADLGLDGLPGAWTWSDPQQDLASAPVRVGMERVVARYGGGGSGN